MGTLLFILLVVLVLAALVGAGGYSVRRYWSPAGSEVVETDTTTPGAGAGIAAAFLAVLVLILQRPYPQLTQIAHVAVAAAVVFTIGSGLDYL